MENFNLFRVFSKRHINVVKHPFIRKFVFSSMGFFPAVRMTFGKMVGILPCGQNDGKTKILPLRVRMTGYPMTSCG